MHKKSGTPLIIDIKGNALDDGPGIRSVVFFKGCPLKCVWCQNPEGISASTEISWDSEKCLGCGACIKACTAGAVSGENPFHIDREVCTLCFECLGVCPSGALSRVGEEISVDDIVRKILSYKPFFDTSGGGVTLSGGEPTLYMAFASALLKELKKNGIHTVIETCGFFDPDEFNALMLPYCDMIFMDVKLIDPDEHRKYCGVPNGVILDNLISLHEMSESSGFKIIPRTPLIPGITDTDDRLTNLAIFYRDNGIKSAVMLPNNPIWMEKCAKLGKEYPFTPSSPVRGFYDEEKKADVIRLFSDYGITIAFG